MAGSSFPFRSCKHRTGWPAPVGLPEQTQEDHMYMYKWEDLAKLAKLKQELWNAARDHDVIRFRHILFLMNCVCCG